MGILEALVFAITINLAMFFPAYFFKTDKLTDISYALTFVFVSFFGILLGGYSFASLVIVAMVWIWALRLGGYLLIRIRKIKRDKRFDDMRGSFWRFGRFWLLQGFTVWIVLLPSLMFLQKKPAEISPFAFAGFFIWFVGLCIEAFADAQKYSFINNSANKGKWIDTGLWKYSRHPNYFGEILVWVGIYIYTIFGLSFQEAFIGIFSPAYIIILLLFVSGIPILEKNAEKKWGNDPKYLLYKKHTSLVVILPKNSKEK